MSTFLKAILLVFFLGLPCLAQDRLFCLYAVDADADGDGRPERLVVYSAESGDPTRMGPKELWIYRRLGDKFVPFYKHKFRAAFSNQVAAYQFEMPSTKIGVAVQPAGEGQEYPMVMVIFTPNSEDVALYRYNGRQFEPVAIED